MDADVLPQIKPPTAVRIARVVGGDLNTIAVIILGGLFVDHLKKSRFRGRFISKGYGIATSVEIT